MYNNSKVNVYYMGDTVRLEASFYDWQGNLVDVEFPKVIIYDMRHNKLEENPLGATNKLGTGQYYYNYTTSTDTAKKLIYEFYGELGGYPTLARDMFVTRFV